MVTLTVPAKIDRNEALRYLGRQGSQQSQPVPAAVDDLLRRAELWVHQHVQPRSVYRTMDVCHAADPPVGVSLLCASCRSDPGGLEIRSEDLARLLLGCTRATLAAVTLGAEVDDQISALSLGGELAAAAVLDAVASAAAECAADDTFAVIADAADRDNHALTRRWSPGYGDLALSTQPELLALVGANVIGVRVTPSYMLMPQKSITAIAGWRPAAQELPAQSQSRPCHGCAMEHCPYRRDLDGLGRDARC